MELTVEKIKELLQEWENKPASLDDVVGDLSMFIGMVMFLLAQLDTIERETAEKIIKLAVKLKLGGDSQYNGALSDLICAIRNEFLKENGDE